MWIKLGKFRLYNQWIYFSFSGKAPHHYLTRYKQQMNSNHAVHKQTHSVTIVKNQISSLKNPSFLCTVWCTNLTGNFSTNLESRVPLIHLPKIQCFVEDTLSYLLSCQKSRYVRIIIWPSSIENKIEGIL